VLVLVADDSLEVHAAGVEVAQEQNDLVEKLVECHSWCSALVLGKDC